jgi:hypothetical protein
VLNLGEKGVQNVSILRQWHSGPISEKATHNYHFYKLGGGLFGLFFYHPNLFLLVFWKREILAGKKFTLQGRLLGSKKALYNRTIQSSANHNQKAINITLLY